MELLTYNPEVPLLANAGPVDHPPRPEVIGVN